VDWKSIMEKTLVTVFAGLIFSSLAWVATTIFSKENFVEAHVNWIEVDNPFPALMDRLNLPNSLLNDDDQNRIKSYLPLARFLGYSDVRALPQKLTYSPKMKLGEIKIENSSNTRTGELEISIVDGLLIGNFEKRSASDTKFILNLQKLEPGKSVTVTFIYLGYSDPQSDDLLLLQDGARVPFLSELLPFDLFFLKSLIVNYPFSAFLAYGISTVVLLLLVGAGLLGIFIKDKIAFTAKNLTSSDVTKYLKVIEYIKLNLPEKLPKNTTSHQIKN
jgi:hypothetical protein